MFNIVFLRKDAISGFCVRFNHAVSTTWPFREREHVAVNYRTVNLNTVLPLFGTYQEPSRTRLLECNGGIDIFRRSLQVVFVEKQ